jgi:hypothetical protein
MPGSNPGATDTEADAPARAAGWRDALANLGGVC